MTAVFFADNVEKVPRGEAETAAELLATMRTISATTFKDDGRAIRAAHAKSHALLEAELTVLADLSSELAQGLFVRPRAYRAALRISTAPGDLLPDAVSTARGLAIKIFGVVGDQLSGDAADTTQDFLLVDGPAFSVATPEAFVGSVRRLAATTDRAEGLKVAFSTVLRGVEGLIEAVGGKSGALIGLGGHRATNPLGETYYSQVPIRYGDHIAKVAAVPVGPLAMLKNAGVELHDRPDALRATLREFFADSGAEWEIRVQLCRDLATMPVEDASVVWPEDASPYLPVARLTAAAQPSWSADHVAAIDDGSSFSPWHGLVAHRPLGGIMRARKMVYAAMAGERSTRSGCPFDERARKAVGGSNS